MKKHLYSALDIDVYLLYTTHTKTFALCETSFKDANLWEMVCYDITKTERIQHSIYQLFSMVRIILQVLIRSAEQHKSVTWRKMFATSLYQKV